MDPFEKYDMTFNGAVADADADHVAGKVCGKDNGWVMALIDPVIVEFDKTIMKYPNIKRFPGGASNDLVPNLQHPENPVPLSEGRQRAAYRRWVGLIAVRDGRPVRGRPFRPESA